MNQKLIKDAKLIENPLNIIGCALNRDTLNTGYNDAFTLTDDTLDKRFTVP
jgi:hypothetical protein